MPKLSCLCGHVINLSPIPNPAGLFLYGERAIEELREEIDALFASSPSSANLADQCMTMFELRRDALQAYECTECGRVAVFGVRNSDEVSTWLRPERSGDPRLGEMIARRSTPAG